MPLYVITPPDPPVGADWQAVVPGQYLYDVIGITATLDTGGSPDLPTDISGNGNNGTYTPSSWTNQFVTGALAGDDGIMTGIASPATNRGGFIMPPAAMPFNTSFTIVWWSLRTAAMGGSFSDFTANAVGAQSILNARVDGGGVIALFVNGGGCQMTSTASVPEDGSWHQIAITYNAGTQTAIPYLDGAALVKTVDIAGPVFATPATGARCAVTAGGVPVQKGGIDEAAYIPSTLSAGDIATLFATAPNFAAYEAAQLALVPLTYYHLDGVVSGGGGRQVALEVTNGTDTLELVPSGFTKSTAGGPFHYSWQPKLAASTQTTDGLTTTVAIPQLTIPAGYTIGARTLDLSGGDQWSDVNIWWDSTLMDALDPAHQYAYPPGFQVLYEQDVTVPVGQWRVF